MYHTLKVDNRSPTLVKSVGQKAKLQDQVPGFSTPGSRNRHQGIVIEAEYSMHCQLGEIFQGRPNLIPCVRGATCDSDVTLAAIMGIISYLQMRPVSGGLGLPFMR